MAIAAIEVIIGLSLYYLVINIIITIIRSVVIIHNELINAIVPYTV